MNRTLKRVLGLTGSVALGLAGAVTFASAAQAHHPEISGSAVCVDAGWEVTWEVKLVGPVDGKITEINPNEPAIDGSLQVDAVGKTFTGTQIYPASATEASLEVSAVWYEGNKHKEITDSASGEVVFTGTCEEAPQEPQASTNAVSDCFGIAVLAANLNPEALAEFTITPSVGEPVTGTPEVDAPLEAYFPVEDVEAGLTVTVTADGEDAGVFEWDGGGNCEWGVVYETCDGLEFELSIPEDGVETTYTLTPSEGEEVVVTLAPGETETVAFVATGDELTVAYLIEDDKNFYEGEFPWTKPGDCDGAPAESETPSAAPQLPTTGSSMTIMVSAAAALVAAAAVLFFIARRRRAAADW